MSEEKSVVEMDQAIVAPEIPERTLMDRTMSLNIQSDTGSCLSDNDNDDESPPDLSGVKISLHLSMDQGQMMMGSGGGGTGSKTKKFLESDDAIISQIFSQTICSAGVTPTDETDEFYADVHEAYNVKKNKSSSIESPNRSPNSNEEEEDNNEEMDDDEDDDGLIKGASRLTILNNQQRPSIVIDCFDETPPVTPPEEMTPSAGAAFYFHTTIVDEDDVVEENAAEDDASNNDEENNSSFDHSSSAQLNDDMHLDDELLQHAVAIVDNFTTIVEDDDDDDFVDEIIASPEDEPEPSKTDSNTNHNSNNDDALTISNEETTINQTYKELAESETNEAPTHFLGNTNGFEPPEPALVQLNQVDPIGYTNGSGMGNDSEDDEDDDSCSNNLTAKTYSFDDEQSSSVETHSEEAFSEEHFIEIDETGKKKVTSKSSKSALAGSRATASIETNENGVSKKATMEAIEKKSATQKANAITNGNTTIEAIETSCEESKQITGGPPTTNGNKVKKVRKIKKGSGDSEKENISVHSSIIMFNNICNGSLTDNSRSLSPSSCHHRTNGMNGGDHNYETSPSPPPPPPPTTPPNKLLTTNNKTTSYYHTFNCSRDMKRRKSVNNFLNRDMTNNTINELKNNFERLIEETQRQAGKKQQQTIINNLHSNNTNIHNNHNHMNNGIINNARIFSNRQDILMNTDRKNKKLTSNGDDLSNIDVKSLVTWIPRKKQSVRSKSFSKFDALQKSASKANVNGKPGAPLPPIENNCKACGKTVFQMEQMKAERCIWHKNCFRCEECQKQLNFDTYDSHEGKLYCKPHFKSLFSPKVVEDNEPVKPRKPQMIIAENQPVELPADVVRSSDKMDSGLEELQQLNLKSRFEVFEKGFDGKKDVQLDRSPSGVKRSASIMSKLARFQAKGMEIGNLDVDGIPIEYSSGEEEEEIDIDNDTHEEVLERARRVQKEKPIVCANMDDIKTRFESGHVTTREERREEQKQELQSIRSRLFMGKQAKIKEMYQQAVEQSEQTVTSKVDCDVDLERARSIKEKFEKGFDETDDCKTKVPDDDKDVFEQGISKQSRSIFQELDANVAKQPASLPSPNISNNKTSEKRRQFEQQMTSSCEVVKSGEKVEDVHITTEDVSTKFKFFETYKPGETKKKEFRITPPRDGVVKMPSPDQDSKQKNGTKEADNPEDDSAVAAKSHTASKMLSLFRQMEEKKHTSVDTGPKPLKRFTPPPDENKRIYQEQDSGDEYTDEEVEEEELAEEEEENEHLTMKSEEEGLKAAKEAARARLLREKFERWEKSQIEKEQRDQNNSSVNLYDDNTDEGQVESARSIRAKFETLHETRTVQKEQIKVNRFV